MDLFYIIVSTIAIIILILLLTFIGIKMSNKSSSSGSKAFPPTATTCPDYWTIASDDPTNTALFQACNVPVAGSRNTGSLYDANGKLKIPASTAAYTPPTTTKPATINFTDKGWNASGLSSTCAQQKFMNQYGLMWDGVSNFNGC